MRRLIVLGMAALALTSAACASSGPTSEASREPERCDGRTLLAVSNNTPYDVEIYETRIGSGGRMVVATVSPGYRVLDVEMGPGVSHGSRIVGGDETISATSRPRARDRHTVELRYICR